MRLLSAYVHNTWRKVSGRLQWVW